LNVSNRALIFILAKIINMALIINTAMIPRIPFLAASLQNEYDDDDDDDE